MPTKFRVRYLESSGAHAMLMLALRNSAERVRIQTASTAAQPRESPGDQEHALQCR